MKFKVKGKKFFKELSSLYKEKSKYYSVSPEVDAETNDPTPELTTSKFQRKRKVGKSSYRRANNYKMELTKKDAAHCYKVLGLKSFPNSSRVQLIDTLNGKVYNTKKPNITKYAYAFETQRAALSERLPSRVVGDHTSPRLCRVLASFECWGETHRRLGGGNGCCEYEFLKFMRIEQSLDSPLEHSLKHTAQPVPPHFYPKVDKSCVTNVRKSFGKTTLRKSKTSTRKTDPEPRTAILTKEVRLKIVFGE